MTLSDPDSYFCCLKLFPLAYYIARTSYDISTHESKSACNFTNLIETEGLRKVTGTVKGQYLGTVQDRDTITTDH